MVGHEGEQRVSRGGALGQFSPRPGHARVIGLYLAKGSKAREYVAMHPIAADAEWCWRPTTALMEARSRPRAPCRQSTSRAYRRAVSANCTSDQNPAEPFHGAAAPKPARLRSGVQRRRSQSPTARRRRRAQSSPGRRRASWRLVAPRQESRCDARRSWSSSQFRQVEIENLRGLTQDVVGFVIGRCEALRGRI